MALRAKCMIGGRLRLQPAVGVPPVSGEQRQELARHLKKLGDEAKVAVRMIRQDARKQIATRDRGSDRAVQEATDSAVEEIVRLVETRMSGILRGRARQFIIALTKVDLFRVRFRVRLW